MTWVNFQTIRNELSFEAVLEHYGFDVRMNGKDQVKVHCPFHDDGNPSCGINLAKKVFHCFSCQSKGNVLDFVACMEGFDPSNTGELRKAAIFACEAFDIDGGSKEADAGKQPKAKYRSNGNAIGSKPKSGQKVKKSKPLRAPKRAAKASEGDESSDVSSEVETGTEKPQEASQVNAEAKPINPPLTFELQLDQNHSFLKDREVSKELVETFGLGVAKRGSMKDRLCFPIHNEGGELIAYAGRWVHEQMPEGTPRYLLPKGFEKRLVLFNLNRVLDKRARLQNEGDEAQNNLDDTIVIVEGFWSVMRLHAFGVPVVSTFGDSVSEEQADLLVQAGFRNSLLIFDGDAGGRAGTEQALPVLATRLFTKALMLNDGDKPDVMSEALINDLPPYVR